ncbi:MAG: putative CRISPR-associated protein [Pirellulales bacterium]|nr:putative CRISPR-associated protein [Pirellulales bacterium]
MNPRHRPSTLLCTVGTSLFVPGLEVLKSQAAAGKLESRFEPLVHAYQQQNWQATALALRKFDPHERICGAEINSIASIIDKGYVAPDARLHFLHSATEQGRRIADVLSAYYLRGGHADVQTVEVGDLQDEDPKRFRTKGLRQLVREVCRVIRNYSPASCAINATGGYKAQIAIAVLMGQAVGVPVYYKHERFNEVISFPPLPVALDFEVWMKASGLLFGLAQERDAIAASEYAEDWDERYESLVERVDIDGEEYLELSPAGQIFHETFRERFRAGAEAALPPPAAPQCKRPPHIEAAGWPGKHPEIEALLEKLTAEMPQVVWCRGYYYNPDLPERSRFRLRGEQIEGVYSNGGYTFKFFVETTAHTPAQRAAMVAALNEWLSHD